MGSKNNFYVVTNGRGGVNKICNSWAEAQPLVDGVSGAYKKGFKTLAEAKTCMRDRTASGPSKVKDRTSPQPICKGFYAIANGEFSGIYPVYCNGAEPEVDKYAGCCHKRCGTKFEAEAFIEEWKDNTAEEYRKAIKKHLDDGIRPKDMKIEKRTKDMLLKDYSNGTKSPGPLETPGPLEKMDDVEDALEDIHVHIKKEPN